VTDWEENISAQFLHAYAGGMLSFARACHRKKQSNVSSGIANERDAVSEMGSTVLFL
jgi:hypothetical protein